MKRTSNRIGGKTPYQEPAIKICDYWTRNNICIIYDPNQSTDMVLSTGESRYDDEEEETGVATPRSVWDQD